MSVYAPPPPPTIGDRLSAFGTFIWNSKESTFLGRGGRSWAEIGLFYLVYYICLAGFFTGMLAVFYTTVDEKQPKLLADDSLLKGNPGMGFQPMPDIEYTLVRTQKPKESYEPHVNVIKKALKPYIKAAAEGNLADCSAPDYEPSDDVACGVNFSELTKGCNEDNNFGYSLDPPRPCVLLRLNKIYGWMPAEYTPEQLEDAGYIDEELKERMASKPNMIYVHCTGENPADADNLGGNITYYPAQGFPHYYYPYMNQEGFLPPLVFVQFNSVEQNIGIMVECRALAPNIRFDRQEKEGGVHFELLLDP